MKIEVKAATVTSNIPKDNTTAMTIDAEGMQHIMSLLTNLYRDPETAVIREYYTNAVDAHIAAGVTKPVKVTLPSWDDPTYTVQDFGVGMSEWDIKNVYSQYGASTKRDSNDQSGAFGLGCKSAFAITNQFTVVSVKDGMKCTTLFSMVVNGTYESTTVSNVPTTAGNGTIVKIPIEEAPYTFNQKAAKFFQFSVPGLVEVDGKIPEYAPDETKKLENPDDPTMDLRVNGKNYGESYVIMGNIPYALSLSEIEASLTRLGVDAASGVVRMVKYLTVGIGDVDLTPSREGLMFTEKTISVVDAHMSFLVHGLRDIAIEDLNQSATLGDFFKKFNTWRDIVNVPREINGVLVPMNVVLDKTMRVIERSTWGGNSHTETDSLSLNRPEDRIIVTGYSAENYRKVNNYLTPYMTVKGMNDGTFIITDSANILTNEWVKMSEDFTFVDGDDIIEIGREQRKKERLAASKLNGTAARPKVSYPVLSISDESIRWINHDEIDQNTPYITSGSFYGNVTDLFRLVYRNKTRNRDLTPEICGFFEAVSDHDEIILLGGGRTEKALIQRVKNTKDLAPAIKEAIKEFKSPVTDDLVRYHTLSRSDWASILKQREVSKLVEDILDPEISQIMETPDSIKDAYDLYNKHKETMQYFSHFLMNAIPTIHIDTSLVSDLDRKYPLVDLLSTWGWTNISAKHFIKYLNSIYSEQN